MNLLRRLLLALLADDIEILINRELVNADTHVYLDGEEIAGIARREIQRHSERAEALRWGKD